MTRDEFLTDVNEWEELIDFCHSTGCNLCNYVFTRETMDYEIEYAINEYNHEYSWEVLRDLLGDIATGFDWYSKEPGSRFRFNPLDDDGDFEVYKERVLEWGDYNNAWDNSLEECSNDEDVENDEFDGTSDLSISELLNL